MIFRDCIVLSPFRMVWLVVFLFCIAFSLPVFSATENKAFSSPASRVLEIPSVNAQAQPSSGIDSGPDAGVDLDHIMDSSFGYLPGMLSIALLLLFAVAYFWLSRRLARIGEALTRFAAGDAGSRAKLRGNDPVARLARQFDSMAEQMAEERSRLAESEERLKFALHGSNAGIWDWYLDGGSTYYSPRWKSLLGFSENELLAHSEEWLKRVHPEDLHAVMDALKDHMAGKTEFFNSEHRLRRKDGSYIWVLERGVASRNAEGKVYRMVGALTDITRRKEVESALLGSEEKYRSVVEGVTQVIFKADATGHFVFLNPAWVEATGFAVEATLAKKLVAFVYEEDRGPVQLLLRDAIAGASENIACELRLVDQAGAVRWFSLHARVDRSEEAVVLAGVLTNINSQKATEEALTRSNGERNAILTLSPDGFVLVDNDGKMVFVNPALLRMTHFTLAELLGQPIAGLEERFASLCDPAHPLPVFADLLDDQDNTMYLLRPEKRVLRWLMRNIPNDLGGLHGRVFFFRDVTQEIEVDRLKSEFLSTAAHELRTPMASIFGFSELLLAREFDAATQRDLIQTIHRQTQNLINLVNELLDLARIEARGGKSFKMQEQEIAPILLNALAAQYVPAESHRLEIDLPKRMPQVRVDAEKFQQCLTNVLSNAIKYSPAGGEIRVSARQRTVKTGEQIGVSVKDQGIGMTAEQVAHVFDRFYRADTSGTIPGTGLGMSLVKEIMDIFEGDVTVDSVSGQGSEVVLWLPIASVMPAMNRPGVS